MMYQEKLSGRHIHTQICRLRETDNYTYPYPLQQQFKKLFA
jgi:hypothetical protein